MRLGTSWAWGTAPPDSVPVLFINTVAAIEADPQTALKNSIEQSQVESATQEAVDELLTQVKHQSNSLLDSKYYWKLTYLESKPVLHCTAFPTLTLTCVDNSVKWLAENNQLQDRTMQLDPIFSDEDDDWI